LTFEDMVKETLKFVVELLARDDIRYPSAVVGGMASVIIHEPEIWETRTYRTEDVDVLLDFREDANEIALALDDLERKGKLEDCTRAGGEGVISVVPIGPNAPPLSIDFTYPSEEWLVDLFKHIRLNAKEKLDEIHGTVFYLARLEDTLLSKAVIGRRKDKYGLKLCIPHLKKIDWDYFWAAAEKNRVKEEVVRTFREIGIEVPTEFSKESRAQRKR